MKIKCQYCGKEYSKKGIGTHIWRTHGEGKNFDPNKGYKNKTRNAWNKGLTKETDDRVKSYSETRSSKISSGEIIPSGFYSQEYRDSPEYKNNCSKGGGFRENAGRGKKEHKKNIDGTEYLLRSSFEVKVAEWLNDKNILWVQPKSILYRLNGEDRDRRYYPDFYIPSKGLYIETKNDYLLSIQQEKMKAVSDVLEGNILILSNKHIESLDESLNSSLV